MGCRDGLVWVRDVSRRNGCKTELLLEDDDTVDVAGWELLSLGDRFMISGGAATVFKFVLREISSEERRRWEAARTEAKLDEQIAMAERIEEKQARLQALEERRRARAAAQPDGVASNGSYAVRNVRPRGGAGSARGGMGAGGAHD